jgi:hypothetical protein
VRICGEDEKEQEQLEIRRPKAQKGRKEGGLRGVGDAHP